MADDQDELRAIVAALKAQGHSDAVIAQAVQRWDETHPQKSWGGAAMNALSDVPAAVGQVVDMGKSIAGAIGRGIFITPQQAAENRARIGSIVEGVKNLPQSVPRAFDATTRFVGNELANINTLPGRAVTAVGDAFYEHPLLRTMDAAALASGAGEVAALSKVPAIARGGLRLAKAAEVLDPLSLTIKGGAKVADNLGKGAILATVRPSAATKADFKMTGREAAQRIQDAGTSNLRQARENVEAVSKRESDLATKLKTDPRKMDIGEVIDELDTGQARSQAEGHAEGGGSLKEEKSLEKKVEVMKQRNARKPPPEPPEPRRGPIEVGDDGNAPIVGTVLDDVPAAPPDAPAPPLRQLDDPRRIYDMGPEPPTWPQKALPPAPPGIAEPGMNIELHQEGFPHAPRKNVPPSSSTAEPIPMRASPPDAPPRVYDDAQRRIADELRQRGLSDADIEYYMPGVFEGTSTAMVRSSPAAMATVVDESTGLVRRPAVRIGARGGGRRPPGPNVPLFEPLDSERALRNKRAAQSKAAKAKNEFTRVMEQGNAAKYNEGIRQTWPEMGEAATNTQDAISINRMFDDAEMRKGTGLMPKLASAAVAGGPTAFFMGGPAGVATAAGAFGLHALSEAPEVGAKIGIAGKRFHDFAMNPKLLRLAQTMRAAGAAKEEIDAAVERAAMAEELAKGQP